MTKPSTPPRKTRSIPDAVALLKADHASVHNLFSEYEKSRNAARKQVLLTQICSELSVHMQIEEELFYPAVTAVLKNRLIVPEASVEHAGIKDLIGHLEATDAATEMVDAQVKVLSEYVEHHVHEEHTTMFPKVLASTIDIDELGVRMAARKRDLIAQAA